MDDGGGSTAAPASSKPATPARLACPVAFGVCTCLASVTAAKSLIQAQAVAVAVDGRLQYSTFSLIMLVELSKLALSCILASALPSRSWPSRRESALFALPAILYCVENNFVFVILRYIDAATLAVVWNVKILITAVMLRLVLKRMLGPEQWGALFLLAVGVTVSRWDLLELSFSGSVQEVCDEEACALLESNPSLALGLACTLFACSLTSGANVVEEKLLKGLRAGSSASLYCQNVVLYCWGFALNALVLLVRRTVLMPDASAGTSAFFPWDDRLAWGVLLTQSVSGILISVTFKFMSNIAALYSHAGSMVIIALCTPSSASVFFKFGMSLVLVSLGGFYHAQVRALMHGAGDSPCCANATGGWVGCLSHGWRGAEASNARSTAGTGPMSSAEMVPIVHWREEDSSHRGRSGWSRQGRESPSRTGVRGQPLPAGVALPPMMIITSMTSKSSSSVVLATANGDP